LLNVYKYIILYKLFNCINRRLHLYWLKTIYLHLVQFQTGYIAGIHYVILYTQFHSLVILEIYLYPVVLKFSIYAPYVWQFIYLKSCVNDLAADTLMYVILDDTNLL